MDQVINDVKIFDNQDIKKKILLTHPRKHHWKMFCSAKIREKLNSLKKIRFFKYFKYKNLIHKQYKDFLFIIQL